MTRPLVTIGMPARNAEDTVATALASIQNQTFTDWELLAIDDGSDDRTADIIHSLAATDPRIVPVVSGDNLGLVPRLNEALDRARGDFFARMDADDFAYPERLERQVDLLHSCPRVDLVGTSMITFSAHGDIGRKWSAPERHEDICARPAVGFRLFHPTWLGRTAWFRSYRYREAAGSCEDQDLLRRSYRRSVFANLSQPLMAYRLAGTKPGRRLRGRFNYIRLGARDLLETEGLRATKGVAWHFFKAGLDSAAVVVGAEQAVLRLSGVPASKAEREQWHAAYDLARSAAHRPLGSDPWITEMK